MGKFIEVNQYKPDMQQTKKIMVNIDHIQTVTDLEDNFSKYKGCSLKLSFGFTTSEHIIQVADQYSQISVLLK